MTHYTTNHQLPSPKISHDKNIPCKCKLAHKTSTHTHDQKIYMLHFLCEPNIQLLAMPLQVIVQEFCSTRRIQEYTHDADVRLHHKLNCNQGQPCVHWSRSNICIASCLKILSVCDAMCIMRGGGGLCVGFNHRITAMCLHCHKWRKIDPILHAWCMLMNITIKMVTKGFNIVACSLAPVNLKMSTVDIVCAFYSICVKNSIKNVSRCWWWHITSLTTNQLSQMISEISLVPSLRVPPGK